MLHFLWGALVSVAVVANEGTTPCGRLEAPLYRSDGIDRHAQVLADCEACLDALEFATDYYDAIPLVSTRLFQLQAYAWARNDLATHAQKFATLARRRATLAEKIDAYHDWHTHHNATGILERWRLSPAAFAVFADATQFSTELYFFAIHARATNLRGRNNRSPRTS